MNAASRLTGVEGLARLSVTVGGRRAAIRALQDSDGLKAHLDALRAEQVERLEQQRQELVRRKIVMLIPSDPEWPERLSALAAPPMYLFCRGHLGLLRQPAIGMCGSRSASERGLAAARHAGETVAANGRHIVSGYARGVDTETHLAALSRGAGTVIVLAEGILHFRVKGPFRDVLTCRNSLVLSQFPPTQRWSAGSAMARNGLICSLGEALVVVEAGERGGTLDAGRQALRIGRPVLALQYGDGETPPGNRLLFAEGARRVASTGSLVAALAAPLAHAA